MIKKLSENRQLFDSKISALIVTYADRGALVQRLCHVLFMQGIKKIFIVDNDSRNSSKIILNSIAQHYGNSIQLISFEKNVGTATAFKVGMKAVSEDSDSEFLWILDDDNIPEDNALSELKSLWLSADDRKKQEYLMLASIRASKNVYRRAVCTHKPDIIIGERNYFRAFHLVRLLSCFSRKGKVGVNGKAPMPEHGDVSAAPYGGMFFHKNLFNTIGFPDERFYIYSDDHEFSHRLILRGGRILVSLKSVLHDYEESWNAKGLGVFNISKHPSKVLLYYSIRNRVHLELKITVNNYITYFINAMIYTGVVFIITLLHFNVKNFLAFWRGLYDGMSGRLGVHRKYKLV